MNGITLIGMSGVGKSKIGAMLAKNLGFSFVDLDDVIKEKEGESHVTILQRIGDRKFLEMEERHALGIPLDKKVFSPGGSIIYSAKAMEKIKNESMVFYLKMSFAELVKRVGSDKESWSRRGIVGLEEKGLENLFHEREPIYAAIADHVIDCGGLGDGGVSARIMSQFAGKR